MWQVGISCQAVVKRVDSSWHKRIDTVILKILQSFSGGLRWQTVWIYQSLNTAEESSRAYETRPALLE